MREWFYGIGHINQALIATVFTWLVTMLGSAVVLCFRRVNHSLMDAMLGFSAGVMLAASYWSLLDPAITQAAAIGINPIINVLTGFAGGAILLCAVDFCFGKKRERSLRRSSMLIFSITLHNIPEGLSVGVAFGAAEYAIDGAALPAACLLALGIGLQNFPEGAAVSLPLRREGYSRFRAFFLGQLSGMVEVAAGVAGAMLVRSVQLILPFMLSFAAGAMVYVAVAELIPESQRRDGGGFIAIITMLGFAAMMALDIMFA